MRAGGRERVDEQRLGESAAALVLPGREPGDERARASPAPELWMTRRDHGPAGSVTTRRFHGSNPGRLQHLGDEVLERLPVAHRPLEEGVLDDGPDLRGSSASVASRTAYPAGSGRAGDVAPSGSSSTQLVQRTW